jgi:hypothetical protein
MSADELIQFGNGNNPFFTNNLLPTTGDISAIWNAAYYDIYTTNAAIEGLQASATLSTAIKNQLTGEAKFLRAFIYFYLVNYFGDVPLATTTAYAATSLLPRSPATIVYQQIISDLKDAKDLLATDYSVSKDERTRANAWAATALLARVYLYTSDWANAEAQATAVINNTGDYTLAAAADLNTVFLANNREAILQLQDINIDNFLFATQEGNTFIPPDPTINPNYILTDQLLAAFEPDDLRRINWVDSNDFSGSGTFYYYPHKYKVRETTPDNITEYYVLLRLAEQYLIRAEARAQQSNPDGALADVNMIRLRANLLPLSDPSISKEQLLAAIAQERRVEFFAEWGHRWFDLKRTGQADAVLGPIKPQWKETAKLFPIPLSEIEIDPNLSQNKGY